RILRRLEIKAFLHAGLKVTFKDQTNGVTHTLEHEGGIRDYLGVLVTRAEARKIVEPVFTVDRTVDNVRLDLAVAWTDAPRERLLSYVNGISTEDGGTHEQGF